ncbi:MAG: MGMT family protein [Planctomycetota bacterium]|nr:MGMT family protein [Planctomycetota bacterium]
MFRPTRHSISAATEVSRVNVFPSGLGWVATAWQHKRLVALTFGHRSPQLAVTAARNRIPLVIPCHRVVGAAGALGGFSAPDGINLQRRLLQLENTNWKSTD